MINLLKNVSIYFLGNVINRMMGFVVAIISTHFLCKSDVGLADTLIYLINIFLTIASAQIWMAIIRFICDYKLIQNKFRIISTGYFIQFVAFAIYSIVFVMLTVFNVIKTSALELFLLSFGYVFNQNVQFACRGLEKNKLYALSGVMGSIANLVFFIIFLFGFKLTYNALILSTACSYIFQGLFIEFFLQSFKKLNLKYVDLDTIKKMLKYSIPTTFNSISYWINQSASKIILTFSLGTDSTGLFTTANKMNSLIGIFLMSFNFAFQEFSFNIYYNKEKNKIYNQTFNYFVRFISCGILLLMPLTIFIFSFLIGSKYNSAKYLIPLLYLGCIFESIQNFLGSIMQAEKKVNLMFISQTAGSIVTVVTMFLTVNFLKIQSAGLSMVLCYLTVCVFRLIAINPKIKLKFNLFYLVHYIPIFIISVLIYLNSNIFLNFIFLILVSFYCAFCTFDLIKKFSKKILIAINRKTNNNRSKIL